MVMQIGCFIRAISSSVMCIRIGSYLYAIISTLLLTDQESGGNCVVPIANPVHLPVSTEDIVGSSLSSESSRSDAEFVEIDLLRDLKVFSSQMKGLKDSACEDRTLPLFSIPLDRLGSASSCVMIGVLDGHGGSGCVEYMRKQLPGSILDAVKRPHKRKACDSESVQTVLREAFVGLDKAFMYAAKRHGDNSGSTIATCTLLGPSGESHESLKLLLGSLGDSRAVLYKRDPLTCKLVPSAKNPVHRPTKPSEIKRILAEGGQVNNVQGIDRVLKRVNQTTLGLSVSRAFGDYLMKDPKPVISNIAEFTSVDVDLERDECVVLGTDGVFDFISLAEIGTIVDSAQRTDAAMQQAAEHLVNLARTRGSTDDRTCVIVDFAWNRPSVGSNENDPSISNVHYQ